MRITDTFYKETRGYGTRTGDRRLHRRYFVFVDQKGRQHHLKFPVLQPVEANRDWGQVEARRIIDQLVVARQQMQAPAAFVAECMKVAPEIVYRLEHTKRDATLSSVLRYAAALGLEFQVVETPT